MHEVAALSKFTLMLLIKNLTFSGAVQLAIAPGILGPQLLNSVCKKTSILIWTISLFHKILAKFNLDLTLPRVCPFG